MQLTSRLKCCVGRPLLANAPLWKKLADPDDFTGIAISIAVHVRPPTTREGSPACHQVLPLAGPHALACPLPQSQVSPADAWRTAPACPFLSSQPFPTAIWVLGRRWPGSSGLKLRLFGLQ